MVGVRITSATIALAAVLGLCACTAGHPTTPAPTATPASSAHRPVVIDTDMAGDDIIAIATLLTDPTVDLRAIAVDGTGEVHCAPGIANARRLLDAFSRTDVKVGCGRETPGAGGRF